MSRAATASPCPFSLTFSPHTAELSTAQNNLGGGVEGVGVLESVPRLSPSWELIQLSKCPFTSIRLHQIGRKSGKLTTNRKSSEKRSICCARWFGEGKVSHMNSG